MTQPSETAREAVERNAQALAAGQFSVVMADVSQQAFAQLMQLSGGAAGQISPAQIPADATYHIEERGSSESGEVFDVTFEASAGKLALRTTWAAPLGRWRVIGIELLSADVNAADTGDPPG